MSDYTFISTDEEDSSSYYHDLPSCPESASRSVTGYYTWHYGSSCTTQSDCTGGGGSEWCSSGSSYTGGSPGSIYVDGETYYGSPESCGGGESCTCIDYIYAGSLVSCWYSYVLTTPSGGTERYSGRPLNLGSDYHDSSISVTCRLYDSHCGSSTASGSATVTVGVGDRTDSSDGCSTGSNPATNTWGARSCDTDVDWTCEGSYGGSDDNVSDTPYSASAGTVCKDGDIAEWGVNCKLLGSEPCLLGECHWQGYQCR